MSMYFAYGSNINLEQMSRRCPDARLIGLAVLHDYVLVFRKNTSRYGVANIQLEAGKKYTNCYGN